MNIKNTYQLEQEVYLKTDPDQAMKLVTGILIRANGLLIYELSGNGISDHYEFEISETKNYKVQ